MADARIALPLFFAAAVGTGMLVDAGRPADHRGLSLDDSLHRLFGSAKEAVGDTLFLRADEYYHGGVIERFEEHDHSKEGLVAASERQAEDWIARINERVKAHDHYHLTSERKRELLPFLALATTLDPHNVEAALTTAYWLESQFDRLEEAIRLLEKASADNPGSWELPLRAGALLLNKKGDAAGAAKHLAEAIRRAEGGQVERFYLVDMHYFLAECLEKQGRAPEALEHYRRAYALYAPQEQVALKGILAARIAALEAAAEEVHAS